MNFDYVIYHTKCYDGVCGLWVAHNYNNKCEKVPMRAGVDPEILDCQDKNLLFIDVCPSLNFILVQSKLANSIKILDHHKSAITMYEKNKEFFETLENVDFVLNDNKSGCQIAWDYLFPLEERPWFINYIGDMDLWKFSLDNSKEINASLDYNNFIDEDNLEKMNELKNYNLEQIYNLVQHGSFINEFIDKLVTNEATYCNFGEMTINDKTYVVAVGTITKYVSLFGNKLANKIFNDKKVDFGFVWYYNPKFNEWHCSLRGHDDSPDLSLIAGHFGGGGHMKASGFKLTDKSICDIIKFI